MTLGLRCLLITAALKDWKNDEAAKRFLNALKLKFTPEKASN